MVTCTVVVFLSVVTGGAAWSCGNVQQTSVCASAQCVYLLASGAEPGTAGPQYALLHTVAGV